jgi:hypothetical protein
MQTLILTAMDQVIARAKAHIRDVFGFELEEISLDGLLALLG